MIMRKINESVLNKLIIDSSIKPSLIKIIDARELTEQQKLHRIINILNESDGLLVTNAIPAKLSQMESRLNIKLARLNDKIIKTVMDDKRVVLEKYRPQVEDMYYKHFDGAYKFGFDTVSQIPAVRLSTSAPSLNEARLDNILKDRTFQASDYTMERLKGEVIPKIKEGIQEGKTLGKTADSLKSEFRDMSNNELMRISRTETHSVYNESKQEAMTQSSVVVGKKWLNSGLPNSRQWHIDADQQIVPFDESFDVMDEPLMYPGDPDGSAENVINCSCSMVPITNQDELP